MLVAVLTRVTCYVDRVACIGLLLTLSQHLLSQHLLSQDLLCTVDWALVASTLRPLATWLQGPLPSSAKGPDPGAALQLAVADVLQRLLTRLHHAPVGCSCF